MTGWIYSLEGLDREAARRVFSILSHLEQIAVMAAERGDGVKGQLADEMAHRDTFAEVADLLGGHDEPPQTVANLIEFLGSLSGPESIACLNVVSEAWLENVFHHVSRWGPWKRLLEVVEAEEARHTAEAMEAVSPNPELQPLVRAVEQKLFEITVDPAFMWPLAWFGTVRGMGAMGRRALQAHEQACSALGVVPGPYTGEIARCGTHAADDIEPRKRATNEWERVAFRADLKPIGGSCEIRWKHSTEPSEVEARVVRAVSYLLTRRPFLNRVAVPQREEIWQCRRPVIGVRRLYNRRRVMTVYTAAPHKKHWELVAGELDEHSERMRTMPYPDVNLDEDLLQLAPPTRVAATVTNVASVMPPGATGHASLVPLEGATWAVCIVSFRKDWLGRLWLTVSAQADHRVHNGLELGVFATELKQTIERGT